MRNHVAPKSVTSWAWAPPPGVEPGRTGLEDQRLQHPAGRGEGTNASSREPSPPARSRTWPIGFEDRRLISVRTGGHVVETQPGIEPGRRDLARRAPPRGPGHYETSTGNRIRTGINGLKDRYPDPWTIPARRRGGDAPRRGEDGTSNRNRTGIGGLRVRRPDR